MTEDIRAFNKQQIAERLALSIRTVEKLIAAGKLRAIKINTSLRVTARDLAQFLDQQPTVIPE